MKLFLHELKEVFRTLFCTLGPIFFSITPIIPVIVFDSGFYLLLLILTIPSGIALLSVSMNYLEGHGLPDFENPPAPPPIKKDAE